MECHVIRREWSAENPVTASYSREGGLGGRQCRAAQSPVEEVKREPFNGNISPDQTCGR